MKTSITQTIRRFSQLKILVLGDVMLDIYDFCDTASSKPIDYEKSGKRAYTAYESIKTIGGAGNVAANLASLGVSISLISVTGNDGHYFTLQDIADELGITHCLIRDVTRPTTVKMRLYLDGEYLLRRDDEVTTSVSHETAMTIENEFLRELDHVDAVILSDYNKGFFTNDMAQHIIKTAQQRKIPVIVDFKPPNASLFKGATITVPNDNEADVLLPGFLHTDDLEKATRLLYAELDCHNIVITLGGNGICGFDGQQFFHAPANRVKVANEVGCGDTVRVGLALGYAAGLSLQEAAELANDAAAVVIQKVGTATVTQDELLEFINIKHKESAI
jgi:D-beta-D-heptose 7-phosphate kinase/D-beta-D-heptose 1-phosphate adenosyltransferase